MRKWIASAFVLGLTSWGCSSGEQPTTVDHTTGDHEEASPPVVERAAQTPAPTTAPAIDLAAVDPAVVDPQPMAVDPTAVEEGSTEPAAAVTPMARVVGWSGWAYEDHVLPTRPQRAGATALEGDLCGLHFAIAGVPAQSRCTDAHLADRLDCMGRERQFEEYVDPDDAEGRALARAQQRAQLFVRDARQELVLGAYSVRGVDCLEGVTVVAIASGAFGSHRAFVALEMSDGSIARAREVTVEDPQEDLSDCANAWDGVDLVPIVRDGALVGSLVVGSSVSVRFALGVGETGPSGILEFMASETMSGYLERNGVLEAVSRDHAMPAPCPIVVADPDGRTNVRPLPNTGRAPVGTLPNGTRLDPVEQRGRWYRIDAPLRGWVFADGLFRSCDPP